MMKIILIKWLICKILAGRNLDSNLSEADDILHWQFSVQGLYRDIC